MCLKANMFELNLKHYIKTNVFISASTGGLLGLFMGFSFLSAIEVIYFISLRLWCAMSKNKKVMDHINHLNK